MNYYDYNQEGIIEISSPEGIIKITTPTLKETLLRIEAINILRKEKQSIKSYLKNDSLLEELIQKVPKDKDIEIIAHKLT